MGFGLGSCAFCLSGSVTLDVHTGTRAGQKNKRRIMALNPNGPGDRHTTHPRTPPLGVAHVIWMGFFYLPGLNKAVDYGTQELTKVCKAAKVDCHFADPRDLDVGGEKEGRRD